MKKRCFDIYVGRRNEDWNFVETIYETNPVIASVYAYDKAMDICNDEEQMRWAAVPSFTKIEDENAENSVKFDFEDDF